MKTTIPALISSRADFLVLGLSVLILAAACVLDAGEHRVFLHGDGLPPLCWWRATPLEGCPSCGLTRGVVAFCHLEWRQSFHCHPAGGLVVLLALLEIPYRSLRSRVRAGSSMWVGCAAVERSLLVMVVTVSFVAWVGRLFSFTLGY